MNKRTNFRVAVVLQIAAVLGGCDTYAVRDLGPGTAANGRIGLNDSGSVVATRVAGGNPPGPISAFGLYNQGTPPQDRMYQVDHAALKLTSSWATAVGPAGFSVGYGAGEITDNKMRGIVLSGPDGVVPGTPTDPGNRPGTLEPLPGFNDSQANDISGYRMIVGFSLGTGSSPTATLWPGWEGTDPVNIADGLPANVGSFAQALNERGSVVGYFFAGDTPASATERPFFRDPGTQAPGVPSTSVSFEFLPNVTGRANAVNESDFVVGDGAIEGSSGRVAWVWRPREESFLGLAGADGGANDINNAGVIVGRAGNRAVYWPNNGGSNPGLQYGDPVDLNTKIDSDLGIRLTSAYAINNSGQIVALGTAGNDTTTHVYLLTPE